MKNSLPKTMTKQFIVNLSSLLHCVNSIFKNINSGGCGHFALMLGRKLESKGYNVNVICLQYFANPDDIAKIKEVYEFAPDELEKLNEKGAYLSHIMLECDGKYIDSTGIYNDAGKAYPKFENIAQVSLNKLELWCDSESWNNSFDVKHLPKMKWLIDKYFNIEISIMKKFNIMVEIFG